MVREVNLSWDSEKPVPEELTIPWDREQELLEDDLFLNINKKRGHKKREKTPPIGDRK